MLIAHVEPLESRRLLSGGLTFDGPAIAAVAQQAVAMIAVPATTVASATLDSVVCGNSASESSHGFSQSNSQTIAGALSQTARQLLPQNPVAVNGGDMTVTMVVDPVKRNYFT